MQQNLAELLAARKRLTPGQVVNVGVAIARELAALHAAGHVYAELGADAVRITDDGRPTLAPARRGGGQPIDDLRALADLLRSAAGSDAGFALLRVLGNPTDAPTFASDLYAVCAPEPLLSAVRALAPRPRATRFRLIAVIAGTTVVAGFVGVASARTGSHHAITVEASPTRGATARPSVASSTTPATPDWRAVVMRLDATRAAAFATSDVGALRSVYAPGSDALGEDEASLRVYAEHHLHARHLHFVVESVRVLGATADRAVLRVTDRLSAYDIVDDTGSVIAHEKGRGTHSWRVVLQCAGGSWRIARID